MTPLTGGACIKESNMITSSRTWMAVLFLAAPSTAQAEAPSARTWVQKQFLITFWCPPPATDENLSAVAREGYNLTWTPAEGLDTAARHGLRGMLTSDLLNPAVLDDSARRAQLDQLIDRVKRHPAMEAYYIVDEPGAKAFPALGRLVSYLRERDPAHLAYINLFPTYANSDQLGVTTAEARRNLKNHPSHLNGVTPDDEVVLRYREHLRQYIDVVQPDLISYDHYHFFKDAQGKPNDGKQYFLNLALIRLAALEAGKPFLNIIQANTIEKSWRLTNPTEMRWLVFTTLAYGGRGISYFTYWGPAAYNGLYQDGKPAPLAADVATLNKELAAFGAAMMELNSIGVYHTAPLPYGAEAPPADCLIRFTDEGEFVLGLFGSADKPTSFMLVNRDYRRSTDAVISIGLRGRYLEELDRTTGKWTRSDLPINGNTRLKLAPGDGRLFRAVD